MCIRDRAGFPAFAGPLLAIVHRRGERMRQLVANPFEGGLSDELGDAVVLALVGGGLGLSLIHI